jgi:predicted phage terminase large subunit-like protein
MGHATPPGGALVDVSRIRYIEPGQLPIDLQQERAWDLAVGTSVNHDYSVGARGGCDKDKNFYLTDINRGRRTWAAQKQLIATLARSEKGRIGVEAVSAFQIAADELRSELAGEASVKPMKVHTSKEVRMTGWGSLIESGKFFIVRGNWTEAFVNELADFPGSPHDDQVDAVSLLYELTRKRQQFVMAISGGDDDEDEPLSGLHGRSHSSGLGGLSSLHANPAQRIFR